MTQAEGERLGMPIKDRQQCNKGTWLGPKALKRTGQPENPEHDGEIAVLPKAPNRQGVNMDVQHGCVVCV